MALAQHSKDPETKGPKNVEEGKNVMVTLLFLYVMGEIYTYAAHKQTLKKVEKHVSTASVMNKGI